jgi:putative thioredoxin
VLLAEALLSTNPERISSLLETITSDSEFYEKASALRTLARLAFVAKDPTSLPEASVRSRYLAGAAGVRSGNFAAALEAFIEVLERNKQYDNGGAKDACKAIFQVLGMRHPTVERFFRPFSSALHS